ncbi:MAG: helix-turn-helix domain-containing protein [Actinomycetota bacterium]
MAPISRSSIDELPVSLRVEEAAEFADVNPVTIRKLIRDGELETVRLGRLIRIPRSSLLAFLRAESEADVHSTLR